MSRRSDGLDLEEAIKIIAELEGDLLAMEEENSELQNIIDDLNATISDMQEEVNDW